VCVCVCVCVCNKVKKLTYTPKTYTHTHYSPFEQILRYFARKPGDDHHRFVALGGGVVGSGCVGMVRGARGTADHIGEGGSRPTRVTPGPPPDTFRTRSPRLTNAPGRSDVCAKAAPSATQQQVSETLRR
jgi:hypothetical protein